MGLELCLSIRDCCRLLYRLYKCLLDWCHSQRAEYQLPLGNLEIPCTHQCTSRKPRDSQARRSNSLTQSISMLPRQRLRDWRMTSPALESAIDLSGMALSNNQDPTICRTGSYYHKRSSREHDIIPTTDEETVNLTLLTGSRQSA